MEGMLRGLARAPSDSLMEGIWDSGPMMAGMYWKVKREPVENSLSEAIRHHAQACGHIAYLLNVHPDRVAEAVRDNQREAA